RPWMAACASASEPISTNPNPFERWVSRSAMTWALSTVPNGENSASSSDSLTLKVRLPTNSFLPTIELHFQRPATRKTLPGSRRKGLPLKPVAAGKAREGSRDQIEKNQRCHSFVRPANRSLTEPRAYGQEMLTDWLQDQLDSPFLGNAV